MYLSKIGKLKLV